jgi:hypothetical protein
MVVEDWFFARASSLPCTKAEDRIDTYLYDIEHVDLGVKRRGNNGSVELKGLIEVKKGGIVLGTFRGDIEIWAKWSSINLQLPDAAKLQVEKKRWLRKFDTSGQRPVEIVIDNQKDGSSSPEMGCNVEWTEVGCERQRWWTLGFEAFGSDFKLERSLISVTTLLNQTNPPAVGQGIMKSYPSWLAHLAFGHR